MKYQNYENIKIRKCNKIQTVKIPRNAKNTATIRQF